MRSHLTCTFKSLWKPAGIDILNLICQAENWTVQCQKQECLFRGPKKDVLIMSGTYSPKTKEFRRTEKFRNCSWKQSPYFSQDSESITAYLHRRLFCWHWTENQTTRGRRRIGLYQVDECVQYQRDFSI